MTPGKFLVCWYDPAHTVSQTQRQNIKIYQSNTQQKEETDGSILLLKPKDYRRQRALSIHKNIEVLTIFEKNVLLI